MNYLKKNCCLRSLVLAFVAAAICACTGRSYLIVDYQVPEAGEQLAGQTVRLEVVDRRMQPRIMAAGARHHFRDFEDQYSLAWVMPDQERILAGEHDLIQLVRTTFAKRLERMGARVAEASQTDMPLLTITMERLIIDLKDHQWEAVLTLEASLSRDDHPTVTERVSGNAQRVRIVGRKGADTVFSDILSDAVNQLNLYKLFQRAALIS